MLLEAWRISHARYADRLFDGEGAKQFGGRFNPPGVKAVYLAGSLSLAMLELLVQVSDRRMLEDRVACRIRFPRKLLDVVDMADLPPDWDHRPPGRSSQEFGGRWLSQGGRPLLRLPSVIVPGEYNYLLNPGHKQVGAIEFGPVRPLRMDQRLMGS